MNVIVLLADGARHDWLVNAMDSGHAPAMARLRDEGSAHAVTTVFPSVTGLAYAAMLMGRFPGGLGLPGLRWFDRARTRCTWPDYARSYIGAQMLYLNGDMQADAPTIFELVPGSVGALSVITRGLSGNRRLLALSPKSAVRASLTHFLGSVPRMLDVDREVQRETIDRAGKTKYMFSAFGCIDKISHAEGHESPRVFEALTIVDDTLAAVRAKLERTGEWKHTRVWITSDHGHAPVSQHEDLQRVVAGMGHRVAAHPWMFAPGRDTAVMVGGNAMAHVYVDLARRDRPYVGAMSPKARELCESLLERPSVDLLIAPLSATSAEVHHLSGGHAIISKNGATYSYQRATGDPLQLGTDLHDVNAAAAYDACIETGYPDAIVQIVELATAPRSGDIILSGAPGWDFRARYEPLRHKSSHGTLRREHMLVPLISNAVPRRRPRRTTDLFASTLATLGLRIPAGLDGESFE